MAERSTAHSCGRRQPLSRFTLARESFGSALGVGGRAQGSYQIGVVLLGHGGENRLIPLYRRGSPLAVGDDIELIPLDGFHDQRADLIRIHPERRHFTMSQPLGGILERLVLSKSLGAVLGELVDVRLHRAWA